MSKPLVAFLVRVVFGPVIAVGLLFVRATLGVKVTPLFAMIGGAPFTLTLAFQDTLGNLARGLMIMINRPFGEDGYVLVGDVAGTVRLVCVVATPVTKPDKQGIGIPNKSVWGNVITKVTASETRRVDQVFGIHMAAGDHPEAPVITAVVLIGSVLAITLAKSLAELMARAPETGERATRQAWHAAGGHSSPTPTVAMANLPTLCFLAAGAGWPTPDLAVLLSQGLCVALLAVLGARVGWVIDARVIPALLGGVFVGGIAAALAILKVAID